jgi:hypothetical protein
MVSLAAVILLVMAHLDLVVLAVDKGAAAVEMTVIALIKVAAVQVVVAE